MGTPVVSPGMNPNRRSLLAAVAAGGATLAGCLGGDGERVPTESPPKSVLAVTDSATARFATRESVGWDDGTAGYAVVVDSEERQRALLRKYDPPDDRRDRILEFLDDIDYGSERLVLVESVGPDGCHDRLELETAGIGDSGVRVTATVEERNEEGCTEAPVYPSSLLRAEFNGDPPDRAAVEVTDGRGESATVKASVDDPLSPAPGDLPGSVRPEAEADPIAPLSCDRAGVERHDQRFDEDALRWGDHEQGGETTLSMRVDQLSYDYGDTLNASLTNVADGAVETGNSAKYNLQVRTEEGWQDVRVVESTAAFEYTDEAVSHAPGEGFEWSIELTEEGIIESSVQSDAEVCPDLQSGRHRLAYFGVEDGAVAVGFDLSA